MSRSLLRSWLAPLLLLLAACGDEEPLAVGSELLPTDALRSFELVLEPSQYLLRDTSFALYGTVGTSDFAFLARDYGGVLDAVEFVRYPIPSAISVVDTAGRTRVDSAFTILRGEVIMVVDTVATPVRTAVRVSLHELAEEWEPTEVDWDFRRTGVRWSVPGGTTGDLLDSAHVARDSVILDVDSATLRQWADTTNELRGVRLSLAEGPLRLRGTGHPRLKLYARSTHDPDTVFTAIVTPTTARMDYRPQLGTTAPEPRLGGTPTWRTMLQLRPDLGAVQVSCGPGCTMALRDASITRAELVLQPRTPPPGFDPELPIQPQANEALVAPEFPLPRSPIGTAIGTTRAPIQPAQFTTGGAPAYLLVTEYLRRLVIQADTVAGSPFAGSGWLTLQHGGTTTVGVGSFVELPRLRLVLSSAREIQLP